MHRRLNYDVYPFKSTIDDFLNLKINEKLGATSRNRNNFSMTDKRDQLKIRDANLRFCSSNKKQRTIKRDVNSTVVSHIISTNGYEKIPLTPTDKSRGFRFVFSPSETQRNKDMKSIKS